LLCDFNFSEPIWTILRRDGVVLTTTSPLHLKLNNLNFRYFSCIYYLFNCSSCWCHPGMLFYAVSAFPIQIINTSVVVS
jgi:hypothetical protein